MGVLGGLEGLEGLERLEEDGGAWGGYLRGMVVGVGGLEVRGWR